jgi:cell division protein FtsB
MMLTNIQKRAKHYWRIYGTMNNIVVVVALVIAASWAWGSVMVMQRNFALQKDADEQQRQLELTQLEVETLKYQQNYYSSDEYKDLAARTYLGLASPGEKVLILPPNSASVKDEAVRLATKPVVVTKNTARNNIDQWINFLAGNSALHLRE